MSRQLLLIQFFFVLQEEGSDMSPVKEAWEVLLPEESQAGELGVGSSNKPVWYEIVFTFFNLTFLSAYR